jgi:hypothetical protein
MEKLTETPKQSAADLRDVAWNLLKLRKHASDQLVRGELARRALELAQVAAQLDYEAARPRSEIFDHGKSGG